jgi:homogentisate phytyltransferase/homogentisate geranylgeranyltransferase
MSTLKTFWEFTRPHTIIGSFLSIVSLYTISVAVGFPQNPFKHLGEHWLSLLSTLISALACNLYITGLNQVQDFELDKINKPWLPIPAGTLSLKSAKQIVIYSGLTALAFAVLNNIYLLALIIIIMVIGTAYSLPPLKFKKHHIAAAASILIVRGVLVNVGMPLQFIYSFNNKVIIPPDVWPLTFFVVGFSLAIAWFKDIPDTGGDKKFNIQTLAIRFSQVTAFRYGVGVVAVSYIGLIALSFFIQPPVHQGFFYLVHALLLMLFLLGASRVKVQDENKHKQFYMGFWAFFFMEYIVYALAYFL